jgi:polyferredoxin
MAFLLRKAFCGWLCPVGTISEWLWRAGRKLFRRNFAPPRWLDVPLRGLKYLLLGFFVSAVAIMPAAAIRDFMHTPFGLIADVKLLNFFRFLGVTGLVVIALLAAGSLLVRNFWCRYLCPYGGLLGLVSLASPVAIRRSEERCIDCAKCAKACPSRLPVDRLLAVHSAECTGCLECVAVCPAEGALAMSIARLPRAKSAPRRLAPWAIAAAIAVLFLGVVGYAKLSGHWQTNVSRAVYQQLVPHANQATHPMP